MLLALGEFRDAALVQRALALTLTDTVGTQDVAILLVRMLGNPAAREATWAFMKRRWPKLRRRLPPMLVTRPIEATPALGTRTARRDVAAFFKANPVPTAARALAPGPRALRSRRRAGGAGAAGAAQVAGALSGRAAPALSGAGS